MSDFGSVLRRTFISIATDEFEAYAALDVASEVSAVRAWLCADDLGDRRFSDTALALRPTESQIKEALTDRRFTGADAVVVYVTGHGQTSEDEHYTILRESDPTRLATTAVETIRLLKWIREHRSLRHVLIIIDLCDAGDVFDQMPAGLRWELPQAWVVWLTAAPGAKAKVGAFTGVLTDVLRELRSGSDRDATDLQPYLESHVVFGLLKRKLEQECGQLLVPLVEPYQVSVCLPNPKYDPARHERVETAPERQDLAILWSDMETHWATRAPAAQTPLGTVFTGRKKLVTRLIEFLQGAPGVLVVSGRVGSGKSAALARVVTCSDPLFRATNEALLRAVEPVPPEGIVDVAVLATGKSPAQIAAQIAAAFGTSGSGMDELINGIDSAARQAEVPPRIVVDALDEAADPAGVVHTLLRRLPVEHLRLLVGVRSSGGDSESTSELADVLTEALGAQRIAADGEDYWESGDLIDYVAQILHSSDDVMAVAEAVEGAAGRSYLVAQLMAGQLAAQPSLRADDPRTRALLASGVTELLERDLEASLSDPQERAVAKVLLRTSALAFGRGISWRDVWPTAATAIAHGRVIGDGDIERLLRHRLAGYLVRDIEDGVTVYRPFHDALRASLSGEDSAAAHKAVALRLRELITSGGEPPPPAYVRRHLASHAAAGGVLDDSVLTAKTLPFLDSQRLSYELRLSEASYGSALWTLLSAWRGVRHRWSWSDPRANAAALDLALVMAGSYPPDRGRPPCPTWRPLWTEWSWGGTVVASNRTACFALGEVQERVVFAVGAVDRVQLLDAATGDQIGAPLSATGIVRAVAMAGSGSGSMIAAATDQGVLHLWEAATGRTLRTWTTSARLPRTVHLAEVDGRMVLAFVAVHGAVEVWDVASDSRMHVIRSGAMVRAIATEPAIGAVAVASSDGEVSLWDLASGARRSGSIYTGSEVNGCVWGRSGERSVLATAQTARHARVWDTETGEVISTARVHTEEVRAIAFGEEQERPLVATGGFDKTAMVWDPQTGDPFSTGLPHPAEVVDVEFGTIDGRLMLATACLDGNIRVWDPLQPSGARVAVPGRIGSVALRKTDRGLLLATGEEGGIFRIRQAANGQEVARVQLESEQRWVVKGAEAVSPLVRLGDRVIATYYEGVVQVRALTDVDKVIREYAHVRGRGFIDGVDTAIGVRSSRHTTKIIDLETSRVLGSTGRSLDHGWQMCWVSGGHAVPLDKSPLRYGNHLVLSTGLLVTGQVDGSAVVGEWRDGYVRLWEVETGAACAEPISVVGEKRAIAVVELNGNPVVVTAHHATVRVWSVRTGWQIAELPFGTPIEAMAVEQTDEGLLIAISGPGVAVTRLVEM